MTSRGMVLGASRRSMCPKGSMLTEEKPVATVPWQEVMSGSEVSVLCHYHAV